MKAKLENLLTRVKYFCATQNVSFYCGMAFAVLSLLTLTVYVPLAVSAALCPFTTIGLYLIGRLTTETPKELKERGEVKDGIAAAILGCLWVLLFVVS